MNEARSLFWFLTGITVIVAGFIAVAFLAACVLELILG